MQNVVTVPGVGDGRPPRPARRRTSGTRRAAARRPCGTPGSAGRGCAPRRGRARKRDSVAPAVTVYSRRTGALMRRIGSLTTRSSAPTGSKQAMSPISPARSARQRDLHAHPGRHARPCARRRRRAASPCRRRRAGSAPTRRAAASGWLGRGSLDPRPRRDDARRADLDELADRLARLRIVLRRRHEDPPRRRPRPEDRARRAGPPGSARSPARRCAGTCTRGRTARSARPARCSCATE